jgi:hypothetical protein
MPVGLPLPTAVPDLQEWGSELPVAFMCQCNLCRRGHVLGWCAKRVKAPAAHVFCTAQVQLTPGSKGSMHSSPADCRLLHVCPHNCSMLHTELPPSASASRAAVGVMHVIHQTSTGPARSEALLCRPLYSRLQMCSLTPHPQSCQLQHWFTMTCFTPNTSVLQQHPGTALA